MQTCLLLIASGLINVCNIEIMIKDDSHTVCADTRPYYTRFTNGRELCFTENDYKKVLKVFGRK